MSTPTIAVIGATGLVGRQILPALYQQGVEPDDVRLFASERSEGTEADYAEETLPVERPGPDAFRGVKAAILAAPAEAARPLALEAQKAGTWVVDLSGAFRAEATVPLVSPHVNEGVLDRSFTGRIVSLALPATQALTAALEPLRQSHGLAFADATVLYGAASRGSAGPERLSAQTAALLNAKDPEVELFPHRLAFNVIPGVGDFVNEGSQAERSLLLEVARVWGGDALPALTTTALWIPTFHGLTLIVSAHLRRPIDAETARATLRKTAGLKVLDEPATHVYPMPMLVTDDTAVHVGRVRTQGERVQLVVTVDNTLRTASSAVTLALELAKRS